MAREPGAFEHFAARRFPCRQTGTWPVAPPRPLPATDRETTIGTLLRPALSRNGNPGAPTILVLAGALDATWTINFGHALEVLHGRGLCNYAALVETEAEEVPRGPDVAWEALRPLRPELVVVSRLASEATLAVARGAAAAGVPVVTHLDDLLFALPDHSPPAHVRAYGPAFRARLACQVGRSHALWASTPFLASALAAAFPEEPTFVLPGVAYLGDQPGRGVPLRLRRICTSCVTAAMHSP